MKDPARLNCSTIFKSICRSKINFHSEIQAYFFRNNHRLINSIILVVHDNLCESQKHMSTLYFHGLMESLKNFNNIKIHVLGESRWALPNFGGTEILRGGLYKLLESIKFQNTEGPPSIEQIIKKSVKSNQGSEGPNYVIDPLACSHPECSWVFTDYQDTIKHKQLHFNKNQYICFCGKNYSSREDFRRHQSSCTTKFKVSMVMGMYIVIGTYYCC